MAADHGGLIVPDQTIALSATGDASDAAATHLAFDAAGNLWATVDANYNVARIDRAALAGAGARAVAPARHVSIGVGALPHGIAFDESGALWLAGSAGEIAALTAEQLGADSTYAAPTTPRSVRSADVGYAGDIAFYPAAAALPLYHGLP